MSKEGLVMKYFVLNPNKKGAYGRASRRAIMAYAQSIGLDNKELASNLIDWINKISHKMVDEEA